MSEALFVNCPRVTMAGLVYIILGTPVPGTAYVIREIDIAAALDGILNVTLIALPPQEPAA